MLALCSCFAKFYNNSEDIERMGRHIVSGHKDWWCNNDNVHQWVSVPDVIICQELKVRK